MDIKRSTQAFSKSPEENLHSDKVNTMSAKDTEKALKGQTTGEVLNKLADPNWIDPSKKVRKPGNAQLDKDAFLKLMLAQMKNQDPTKPMESHEMAAQLAQFTSLEQLNNIHTTLEGMQKAQSPVVNYQALAFIGKRISSDSSKVTRNAGDTDHTMNFKLLGDATDVRVTVKDAGGNPVRKIELGAMKKGDNKITWNGLSDDGMSQRPGEYHITVEAKNEKGKVYAKTQFEGKITGLNYTPEGPVLMVGGQTIRMADVKKIEEGGPEGLPGAPPQVAAESAAALAQVGAKAKSAGAVLGASLGSAPRANLGTGAKPPLKPNVLGSKSETAKQDSKLASGGETLNVQPSEEPTAPPNNLDSVPMASSLLNKIAQGK